MSTGNAFRDHIKRISSSECVYRESLSNVLRAEITPENVDDLETLIKLFELHEESIRQTRLILMLKRQACLLRIMSIYAKSIEVE